MSFNLWVGGEAGGQPLEQSARVIEAAAPDLAGLQETIGESDADNAAWLARRLGWNHVDQSGGSGILTPHPIVDAGPWGAQVALPSGERAFLFNVHLAHAPYQPYQLLQIPYAAAPFLTTADEVVAAARAARGAQIERVLAEIERIAPADAVVFLTGDFNEPSHRDWTVAAYAAGRCPLPVAWPTTRAVEDAGFLDAFRAVHPDPVARPGLTWTPITRPDDPADRHDRIDFVFARGVQAEGAWIVGEAPEFADRAVTPYPSDHRAVVAQFSDTRARRPGLHR